MTAKSAEGAKRENDCGAWPSANQQGRHEGRVKEMDAAKDDELKKRLTPEQYYVCVQRGTERPYTNLYCDYKAAGTYVCIACGLELFRSTEKFHSGSGWPSFYDAFAEGRVKRTVDASHGMERVEVSCERCDAHLGHVFDDGPKPTGLRFCINSAAIDFVDEQGRHPFRDLQA